MSDPAAHTATRVHTAALLVSPSLALHLSPAMATLLNLDARVEHKTGADRPRVGKFRKPNPPTFTSEEERAKYQKGRLAMAARIFDDQGWGIGCAGGLSARDAVDPEVVWVLPRRKPLCSIVSADLIGVHLDGKIVVPSETLRECESGCG